MKESCGHDPAPHSSLLSLIVVAPLVWPGVWGLLEVGSLSVFCECWVFYWLLKHWLHCRQVRVGWQQNLLTSLISVQQPNLDKGCASDIISALLKIGHPPGPSVAAWASILPFRLCLVVSTDLLRDPCRAHSILVLYTPNFLLCYIRALRC